MAEPTLRYIERLILKLGGDVAAVRQEVAGVRAEAACIRIVDAKVDELISSVDHARDTIAALNQITTGVRSLGTTTHDIAIGLSRRMKNLVQHLVEKGLIAVGALTEDERLRTEGDSDAAEPIHVVSSGRD